LWSRKNKIVEEGNKIVRERENKISEEGK